MTKLYKLTTCSSQTYNGCQWGENVTHRRSGKGELCTAAWLHAYTHPLLAMLLNPIHANFTQPQLWECEGDVGMDDRGLKVGCTRLTTLFQLPVPEITTVQHTAFAIGCTYNVYDEPAWVEWARRWVLKIDRSGVAAYAAADAAADAAAARARAAARAAYAAAAAAARAAYAAADAADAAYAAADAADAADAVDAALPLITLAEWAMTIR